MATKKQSVTADKKKGARKMDRLLIAAKQQWEVLYVRLLFYKTSGETIIHPTTSQVKDLIKTHHGSRRRVYASLVEAGWKSLKSKS